MTDDPAERHAQLQATLEAAGAVCGAAEAHGTLCSLICLYGGGAMRPWVAEMSQAAEYDASLTQERIQTLQLIAGETMEQLQDPEFSFMPLLPGDNETISLRASALAHWAQGFLHGLGGVDPKLAAHLETEPLSELLNDLIEITHAVSDADEDAEADEEAYAELVEFLRVAAQLFYLEFAAARGDRHEAPDSIQ